MKAKLSGTNLIIVVALAIAALAFAFWVLLLSPKQEEAKKLEAKVGDLKASLAAHEAEVTQALEARKEFPDRYQQLVVLGKAVPGDDDTASLIVQVNRIAEGVKAEFGALKLAATGGEAAPTGEAPPPEEAPGGAAPASPTEVAASTLPLGATIGPAGLAVMPYELTFEGEFFEIADFMKELDSLVQTENAKVAVNGRLFTINGFSLKAAPNQSFPALQATFSITTYLTPPEEGVPGAVTTTEAGGAVPASATIGATP
jgi:Tfp pilus assembly protein PilO